MPELGAARPDAIVHEATALAGMADVKRFDRTYAATNRLRTEGTDNLLAAARGANIVAQSFAGWPYARTGAGVKTEEDPLEPGAGAGDARDARRHPPPRGPRPRRGRDGAPLRRVLRLADDVQLEAVRKRRFPIVGDGGGVWSFVHLDDGAAATALAVEQGTPGLFNVVDDEPAPVAEWLPALVEAIGAPAPRRVPRWLARLLAGEAGVALMTDVRGASNAKAKRELGWTLRHPSWRQGFADSYAPA